MASTGPRDPAGSPPRGGGAGAPGARRSGPAPGGQAPTHPPGAAGGAVRDGAQSRAPVGGARTVPGISGSPPPPSCAPGHGEGTVAATAEPVPWVRVTPVSAHASHRGWHAGRRPGPEGGRGVGPSSHRWPWQPLLAYVLLLAATVALVARSPGAAPGDRAVAAMAGQDTAMAPDASQTPPWLAIRLPEGIWTGLVATAIPAVRALPPPGGAASWWDGVDGLLAAVRASAPYVLLRTEIPGLDLLEPGPEGGTGGGEVPPAPAATPAVGGGGQPAPAADPEAVAYGDDPLVLVYHTHAEESFLPVLPPGTPADQAFTADRSRSVVRVGDELARVLYGSYGLPVLHLRTRFDAQGRIGAYVRSLAGVQAAMREHPRLHVLLDVHRDDAPRAATTAVVGGRPTARILVVVGNDQTLPNPGWRRNAAWAEAIVRAGEARYPGLFRTYEGRPYYSDGGRFNQHLSPAALLFEIGGQENTLEEALRGADLLASILGPMIRAGAYPR
jgi:stage II sporulation protein P